MIPLSDTQTSRSWNYWLEREFELSCAPFCAQALRGGLASLVEELPIEERRDGYLFHGSRLMVPGEWFMMNGNSGLRQLMVHGSRLMVQSF